MQSLAEQIQARVLAVLLDANTAAGSNVERGRLETPDAQALADAPHINIARRGTAFEPFATGVDASAIEFTLECSTVGDDWETAADALHMQAHAALVADADLARLMRSFYCAGVELQGLAGEQPIGRLTATYRGQAMVRRADLTRHLY